MSAVRLSPGSKPAMLFQPTRPADEPDLMRVSAFQRHLESVSSTLSGELSSARMSILGPSLMQDLMRFEREGRETELLEVLAACIRHARSLLVHLQIEDKVIPLTVFPTDWLVHCTMPMPQLLEAPLGDLRVLNLEPPAVRVPGDRQRSFRNDGPSFAPLGPLLWELALRGARDELLPEIAGNAAYRIAPGVELRALNLQGSMASAVQKLQRQTSSLRDISQWPGFDRERAMRMLNGLYLQAGLMVSRTHPAATNEGWKSDSR